MQNLNLRQLEALCAVVEQGGFSAAAESLFLAQPTVSGHVAALEKELGVSLLLRSGKRGVALTPEGRRVYAHARAILQSCGELSRELNDCGDMELTLAASSIPMQYLLPRLLRDFGAAWPACRFTLLGGDSETVHRAVLDGEAPLGFAGAALEPRLLRYDLLAQDPLVLAAPATERFRALRRQGVTGNDLLRTEPLLLRESGSGTQRAADAFFSQNDIPADSLRVAGRIADNSALLRCVSLGLGCAVISGLAADAAAVTVFPLQGAGVLRRLYLLRGRQRRLSPAARRFAELALAGRTAEAASERSE